MRAARRHDPAARRESESEIPGTHRTLDLPAPGAAARAGTRKRRRSCSVDAVVLCARVGRLRAACPPSMPRLEARALSESSTGENGGNPPSTGASGATTTESGGVPLVPSSLTAAPASGAHDGSSDGGARQRCRAYVSQKLAYGAECLRNAERSMHEVVGPSAAADRGYCADWGHVRANLAVLAADMTSVFGDIARYFATGTPRCVLQLVMAAAMSAGRNRPADARSASVTATAANTLAALAGQLGLKPSHVVVTETDPALATSPALRIALRSARVEPPEVRTFRTQHAEIALLYTERACRAVGVAPHTDLAADAGAASADDGRALGVVVYQVAPWLGALVRMPAKLLCHFSSKAAAEMARQKCQAWAEHILARQSAERRQVQRPSPNEAMPEAERAMEVALCGVVVALLRGTRVDCTRDSFNHLAVVMPQVRERQLMQELVSAARARLASVSSSVGDGDQNVQR